MHSLLAYACTQPLVIFAHPSFWSIQENVRSTTHLLGNTWKPGGGMNFCQSTATPSLAHSLAHDFRTSSGAALRGRSRRSTLHPKAFSIPSPCPCPLHRVAGVQPQMTETRESLLCSMQ